MALSTEMSRPTLFFNVFQRFATSELTHSGIWGWILQSLDDDAPPHFHELRPAARALLASVGVTDFLSPVTVVRERKLSGRAGRVDIEVTDARGRVVVFETKIQARPDLAQRQRYENSYRAEGHDLAAVAILSTTYEEPWATDPPPYLGAEALLAILHAGHYKSDLMMQYVAWLDALIQSRKDTLSRAVGVDARVVGEALQSAAAQWAVMRRLGETIGGPAVANLYCGQNKDGSPWTQLSFSPGATPQFDALFYRLESWRGVPAQFTLRQYQKPASSDKPVRLERLRAMFADAAAKSSLSVDTQLRGARRQALEAKIAQVTMPPATMTDLLAQLPAIHQRFVSMLTAIGWPMGPGRFQVVPDAESDARSQTPDTTRLPIS